MASFFLLGENPGLYMDIIQVPYTAKVFLEQQKEQSTGVSKGRAPAGFLEQSPAPRRPKCPPQLEKGSEKDPGHGSRGPLHPKGLG